METLYRIGNFDSDRFYVTTEDSLLEWRRYIGIGERVYEIQVSKFYIPGTTLSFSSLNELSKFDKSGQLTNAMLSKIFPEESGLQNALQFEIEKQDILHQN